MLKNAIRIVAVSIRQRFAYWWHVRRELRLSIRCNICLEPYVGLAQDCACTNWGGFVGL